MSLEMSLIDRVKVEYDLTVTNPDGDPETLTALDFAVIPARSGVTSSTVWKTLSVSDGTVEVIYCAPQATAQSDDLLVPLGESEVRVREVDGPLIKTVLVDRVLCRRY